MKRLLAILILFTCITLNAQKSEAWKTIALYSGSVITAGVADGLRDDGNKMASHFVTVVSISGLVLSPFILKDNELKWYESLICYSFLRYGFFDYSYNLTRGLPMNYHGSTSIYDNALSQVHPVVVGTTKVMALCVGLSIPFNRPERNKQREWERAMDRKVISPR